MQIILITVHISITLSLCVQYYDKVGLFESGGYLIFDAR